MVNQVHTRRGYFSKVIAIFIVLAMLVMYAVPAQPVYAADPPYSQIPNDAIEIGFTMSSTNTHTTVTKVFWYSATNTDVGDLYFVFSHDTGKVFQNAVLNGVTSTEWISAVGSDSTQNPPKNISIFIFRGVTFQMQNTLSVTMDAGGHSIRPGNTGFNLFFNNYIVEYYYEGDAEPFFSFPGPRVMDGTAVSFGDVAANSERAGDLFWYLALLGEDEEFVKILNDDSEIDLDEITLDTQLFIIKYGEDHKIKVYYKKVSDPEPDVYTVTYDANGGTGAPEDDNEYNENDEVTVLDGIPERLGYTFEGWLYDGDTYYDGDTFDMPAADVTLVAQWTQNEYTVTYTKGAQGTFADQVYSELVYGDDTPAFVGTPTGNPGWTFIGWLPEVAEKVTGDATYVAQWEAIEYTVTYKPGTQGTFADQVYDELVYGDDTPPFAGTPTGNPGWSFNGWLPVVADKVTGDATYVAQWTQDDYTVTYKPGTQGTFADQVYDELVYGDDTPAFVGTPTGNPGWTFNGWLPVVADKVTGDATYVAQWTQDDYTVTYKPGTQGTFADQVYDELVYGDDTPAFVGTPTGNPGWTFIGWLPEVAEKVTGDATYVAQWAPRTDIEYIVHYYLNNTTVSLAPSKTVTGQTMGAVVTENAISISKYRALAPTTETKILAASENVFIFYYAATGTPPPVTTTTTTPTPPPPPPPPATPPANPPDDPPPTTIAETPPPQAAPEPATIKDPPTPLANFAAWALLNLILTIVTGLIMAALLVTYFFKRKDENEDDPDYDEEKVKKHLGLRIITIVATVVAIILFILTQDMSLPMAIVDQWTIWHVVITIVTVALAALSRKTYEEDDEDLEEETI